MILDVERVRASKTVHKSGNSWTLNLTAELKALGVSPGDTVRISIEREARRWCRKA